MHNIIRPVLEKYITEHASDFYGHGSKAIIESCLEPLTNAIAVAITDGMTQLAGTVFQIRTRTEVATEIRLDGKLASGAIKISQPRCALFQDTDDGDAVQILIYKEDERSQDHKPVVGTMKKGTKVSWTTRAISGATVHGHGVTISDEEDGHILVAADGGMFEGIAAEYHMVIYCTVTWLTAED